MRLTPTKDGSMMSMRTVINLNLNVLCGMRVIILPIEYFYQIFFQENLNANLHVYWSNLRSHDTSSGIPVTAGSDTYTLLEYLGEITLIFKSTRISYIPKMHLCG
jgi:hypothetical protein